MRARKFVKLLEILIVLLIIFAGLGQAVLHLWNWLMPAIFGLHEITYWQTMGLIALCWILFRGPRGWALGSGGHWRHRMRERWSSMSPEEREKFRAAMMARCGHPASTESPKT